MKRFRLVDLEFSDLCNHEDTKIAFRDEVLDLFLGEEYSGKTTILNAVQLGLTGRTRGFGEKEKTLCWESLTREGARGPKIKMTFRAGDETVSFVRTKTACTPSQETILRHLDCPDPNAIHAIMECGAFSELDLDRRLRLIQSLLGAAISTDILTGAGVTDMEIQAKVLSSGSIRSGELLANAKRVACQRAARQFRSVTLPIDEEVETPGGKKRLSEIPADVLGKAIAALQAKRDEVFGQIRRDEGAAAGGAAALEAAVLAAKESAGRAQATLTEASAKLAALRADVRVLKDYPLWKQQIEELTKVGDEQSRIIESLYARKDRALQAKMNAERRLSEEWDAKTPCPMCGSVVPQQKWVAHWTVEKSNAEKEEAALAPQIAQAEKDIDATTAEGKRVLALKAALEKESVEAKGAVARAEKELAACNEAVAAAEKRLAEAPQTVSPAEAAERVAELAGLDARLTGARERERKVIAYVRDKKAYDDAEEAAKREDEAAAAYGVMETALGETGIVASLSASPIQRVNEKCAELCKRAFRTEHTVHLGNDCTLYMNGKPLEGGARASRGERFLAGFVVSASLASLSGLGFLMIDEMNLLGARGRDRLIGTVAAIARAAELGQVLAVSQTGRDGWCDACGALRVGNSEGLCVEATDEAGGTCGSRILIPRPNPRFAGFLRLHEVVAGRVTEVLPVATA